MGLAANFILTKLGHAHLTIPLLSLVSPQIFVSLSFDVSSAVAAKLRIDRAKLRHLSNAR